MSNIKCEVCFEVKICCISTDSGNKKHIICEDCYTKDVSYMLGGKMEKDVDWDKLGKCINDELDARGCDRFSNREALTEDVKKRYNQPEYSPLCEEIWGNMRFPTFSDPSIKHEEIITISILNKAVKDIDYRCKKVHFSKVTEDMAKDTFNHCPNEDEDGWEQMMSALALLRGQCKEGKYEKREPSQPS